MAVRISATTRIALIGDSISVGFGTGTVPWLVGFGPLLRQRFQPTIVPGSTVARMPTFANVNATAGRTVANISGTIATFLAGFGRLAADDVLAIQLGINDADAIRLAALDIPTLTTQVNTVIAAYQALSPRPQLWWIGPWAHDSGDDAAQIAQVDSLLGTLGTGLVIAAGGTYTRWSTVTNGGGNAVADGTHPTQQGAVALAQKALQDVTFT